MTVFIATTQSYGHPSFPKDGTTLTPPLFKYVGAAELMRYFIRAISGGCIAAASRNARVTN